MTSRDSGQTTYFAKTNSRYHNRVFGIKKADRRLHIYIIGKTGTGKSTLLASMAKQDMEKGEGLALIDPHGDLAEKILQQIPKERQSDLIYFNLADRQGSISFNPLEKVAPERMALAAAGLIEVFKKIWDEHWGARMEHILRNCVLTLLEQPEATLKDIPWLLTNATFRKTAVSRVNNPAVKQFWLGEFARYPVRLQVEVATPILNKIGAFLADTNLSRIVTQPKSSFKFRKIMDEGKILIVNLSKGQIGEGPAALMGALLVSRMGLAALSRADQPEEKRKDFFLYMDEFQNFTTLSLANMLSELRKYRLNMVLAHQYLSQLEIEVRDAIIGNVGTIMSFRLGLSDARFIEREFHPKFSADDLINLPNYAIFLKMAIDGKISKAFSGETIEPNKK